MRKPYSACGLSERYSESSKGEGIFNMITVVVASEGQKSSATECGDASCVLRPYGGPYWLSESPSFVAIPNILETILAGALNSYCLPYHILSFRGSARCLQVRTTDRRENKHWPSISGSKLPRDASMMLPCCKCTIYAKSSHSILQFASR